MPIVALKGRLYAIIWHPAWEENDYDMYDKAIKLYIWMYEWYE